MTKQLRRKLAIIVTHNQNDDRASTAFTIANDALSSGMEVRVFLYSDGVELSLTGASDMSEDIDSVKPLGELIESFIQNGGVLRYCASCFHHRGFEPRHTIAKASATRDALPLLEWIAEGAAPLSF